MYYFWSLFHFSTISSNNYYGQGNRTSIQTQPTKLALPINQNIFLPPRSAYLQKNDITNECSSSIIACDKPLTVSNLTTKNTINTDINNDGDTQSFVTSIKHNHTTPWINDKNNTTTQVQTNVHNPQCHQSNSTPTKSLKIPSSGKHFLCFQIDTKTTQA